MPERETTPPPSVASEATRSAASVEKENLHPTTSLLVIRAPLLVILLNRHPNHDKNSLSLEIGGLQKFGARARRGDGREARGVHRRAVQRPRLLQFRVSGLGVRSKSVGFKVWGLKIGFCCLVES